MPSLAFWKSAKAEQPIVESPNEETRLTAESVLAVKSLDFDPGSQDTGVFVLDEEGNLVLQSPPSMRMEEEEEIQQAAEPLVTQASQTVPPQTTQAPESALEVMTQPSASAPTEVKATKPEAITPPQTPELQRSSHLRSPIPSVVLDIASSTPIDRSTTYSESASPLKRVSTSTTKPRSDSEARRLHRPTELNLSNSTQDSSKPKTELEKRSDMMRNSSSRSRAALRSPTALLHDRLNLSPKKSNKHTEEHRTFVAPTFSTTGCIMPGPAKKTQTFTSASIRAFTESSCRPAWWCKTDKLVVFDGYEHGGKPKTRTSKGLSIARRRGDTETIIIPMDCSHCKDMLNRQEWKYDIQVCKRNVCWDCKKRCQWEAEQETTVLVGDSALKAEGNRHRADSVLQNDDDEVREQDMMQIIGIEQARPKSPIEAVGGIAERLGRTEI